MRRPFFLLAIFLSVLIITFSFFVKEDIFSAGHISNFAAGGSRNVAIKGAVISDPFWRYAFFQKTQSFVVNPICVKITKRWFPAYGDLHVTSYSDKEIKYGDEILFEAKLKSPSLATISEKDPLIITGEAKGFLLKDFAYKVKGLFKLSIERLFKPPERYFLSAVLLGERQNLPTEWMDIFAKTQTMHLLAISGLHVGIIAFIILFLIGLFGIPRNFKYAATILILILYAVMVGARPSVVRATIMGATLLTSYLVKRDADIYNSLGLAAVVILLYNPDQLFDYGFILSFVSVFSIVYMAPFFNRMLCVEKIDRHTYMGSALYYISTLFSASCSVWLGILPLTVNFFNIASPISVIVNILAIPLFFVIIALSVVSIGIHFITPPLGMIFAEAAKFFIAILISSSELFSRISFAYFEAEPQNIFVVILYYIALLGIVEYGKKH